jgi:hypothetical protein
LGKIEPFRKENSFMTTTRRGLGIIAHIANEQWSILLAWILDFCFFCWSSLLPYNDEHFCSRESSGKLYVALKIVSGALITDRERRPGSSDWSGIGSGSGGGGQQSGGTSERPELWKLPHLQNLALDNYFPLHH